MIKRLLVLSGSFAILLVVFFLLVRPWYLGWGATAREAQRWLPGDEIVADPVWQETHAITIEAPVAQVWPWLAQLGQDRGGFYSFDGLENLLGCEMPTTDLSRPDRQSWQVGDKLWMYPPGKAGGIGFATLRTYMPGRALGFATRAPGTPLDAPEDGSWSFVLSPIDPWSSRLIVRGRGAGGRSLLGRAFDRSVFEPVHFVMQRRMMIGIKQVAEGSSRQRWLNHLHIVLWTTMFGLLVAAKVMVLRRRDWVRPLLGFVVAAASFEWLTLGQPPLVIGTAVTLAVAAALWWPLVLHPPRTAHDVAPRRRQMKTSQVA